MGFRLNEDRVHKEYLRNTGFGVVFRVFALLKKGLMLDLL